MKKVISIMALLLVVVMIFSNVAAAQGGIPGSGWWSGEQVQNVGVTTSTISITAYDADSTATYSESELRPAGASVTFTPFTHFASMPDGFFGSAVVSSDRAMKAIVNVTNRETGDFGEPGGLAAAQYQGIDGSAVATTIVFPIAKGDYYKNTTTHYVQNAGSAATSVTAVFKMLSGAVYTYTSPSIEPNRMVVFSIYDAQNPTYTPPGAKGDDGRAGSVTVSASEPIAGVVLEHKTTESPATVVQGTRSLTANDYDSIAYAPVIKQQWYGRFTGIQINNVDTSPISVTVNYSGVDGACDGQTYREEASVGSGEPVNFVQYAGQTPLPANCAASAIITATGQFVAVVNEASLSGYNAAGITYSAIPGNAATTKVSAPLYKDNYYANTSGLQIQNVGTFTATNIVATFQCEAVGNPVFTAVSKPQEVGPGSAVLFFTPSDDADMFTDPYSFDRSACGVTITSDEPIVAIVNEMGWGRNMDDNNYEGFNLP